MSTVNLSSIAYNELNKYEILAGAGITGEAFVINTSGSSGVGNWASSPTVSVDPTIQALGNNPGTNDTVNAAEAQTQLTTLISAISVAGLTTQTLDSAGLITSGPNAGTYNYQSNTRYTSAAAITYPATAITLNFTGSSSEQVFIVAGTAINFDPDVSFNLGSMTAANIFFAAGSAITVTGDGSVVRGNLIADTAITLPSNSIVSGRIYAKNAAVTFAGTESTANYSAQITPTVCYNKGTKILCTDGCKDIYRLIDDIKLGDLVKTNGHGYLPVEYIEHGVMINNPSFFCECMYRLPSVNPEFEDLIVTGGHGILKKTISKEDFLADRFWFTRLADYSFIDGLYLQRAAFCNEFVQMTDNNEYIFYHLSLKGEEGRRYGIWANGVLSESTFKRDMVRTFGISEPKDSLVLPTSSPEIQGVVVDTAFSMPMGQKKASRTSGRSIVFR